MDKTKALIFLDDNKHQYFYVEDDILYYGDGKIVEIINFGDKSFYLIPHGLESKFYEANKFYAKVVDHTRILQIKCSDLDPDIQKYAKVACIGYSQSKKQFNFAAALDGGYNSNICFQLFQTTLSYDEVLLLLNDRIRNYQYH
jgi:hypothetical protein